MTKEEEQLQLFAVAVEQIGHAIGEIQIVAVRARRAVQRMDAGMRDEEHRLLRLFLGDILQRLLDAGQHRLIAAVLDLVVVDGVDVNAVFPDQARSAVQIGYDRRAHLVVAAEVEDLEAAVLAAEHGADGLERSRDRIVVLHDAAAVMIVARRQHKTGQRAAVGAHIGLEDAGDVLRLLMHVGKQDDIVRYLLAAVNDQRRAGGRRLMLRPVSIHAAHRALQRVNAERLRDRHRDRIPIAVFHGLAVHRPLIGQLRSLRRILAQPGLDRKFYRPFLSALPDRAVRLADDHRGERVSLLLAAAATAAFVRRRVAGEQRDLRRRGDILRHAGKAGHVIRPVINELSVRKAPFGVILAVGAGRLDGFERSAVHIEIIRLPGRIVQLEGPARRALCRRDAHALDHGAGAVRRRAGDRDGHAAHAHVDLPGL